MDIFPDESTMDHFGKTYLKLDPSSGDIRRMLNPSAREAEIIRRLRSNILSPIYFVRGNHEDFEWLASLAINQDTNTAPVDEFDCFHYAPDGTILTCQGLKIGFLGGLEFYTDNRGIDREKYQELKSSPVGSIDILITHEGPYGFTKGFRGDVQGSQMITELIEALQPRYFFSGHTELVGPCHIGETVYLNLGDLVYSARWEPEKTGLKRGCMAILDTDNGDIEIAAGGWLDEFETPFNLIKWYDKNEKVIH